MLKENCNECKKELDVEKWISRLLKMHTDVQIICKECDEMSGRDERPTFKITKDSFYKMCPHCHQSNAYDFKNSLGGYRWQNHVGTLMWKDFGLTASLRDGRTTVNSIGEKILICVNCKEIIEMSTKIGKLLLEVFRDVRAEDSIYWYAALEKHRAKTPIKVWWEIKYDPL